MAKSNVRQLVIRRGVADRYQFFWRQRNAFKNRYLPLHPTGMLVEEVDKEMLTKSVAEAQELR